MTKLEAYTVVEATHTVDNFTLDISLNEEEIEQGWELPPGNINPITIPRRRIDRFRGVATPANFKIMLNESKISSFRQLSNGDYDLEKSDTPPTYVRLC